MVPRDMHRTAFVIRYDTYSFKVMALGLCNAPATFQRLMHLTMTGLNYEIFCWYILTTFCSTPVIIPTHLERLETLLVRLRSDNLKIKPTKCHFLQTSVEVLVYVVSCHGIQTDTKKVEAIENWSVSRKFRDIRSFVGLCSYYRKFVEVSRRLQPRCMFSKSIMLLFFGWKIVNEPSANSRRHSQVHLFLHYRGMTTILCLTRILRIQQQGLYCVRCRTA